MCTCTKFSINTFVRRVNLRYQGRSTAVHTAVARRIAANSKRFCPNVTRRERVARDVHSFPSACSKRRCGAPAAIRACSGSVFPTAACGGTADDRQCVWQQKNNYLKRRLAREFAVIITTGAERSASTADERWPIATRSFRTPTTTRSAML